MKPIKLIMQAFGSYGDREEIDFDKIGQGIFLITGDTGAGKTTIFDGISFALYGKASGDVREVTKLRSQYAAEEYSTFVELIFAYRGKSYTIRRTPPYMREKKRNKGEGGMVQEKATASLTMPDGTCYTAVKEVNSKIEEIMGVNADQFCQIVMIAQGEFQKLLLASSKERKEIFSKLFHTDAYRQIQDALRMRQKNLESEIEKSSASFRTLLEGIEVEKITGQEVEENKKSTENILAEVEGKNIKDELTAETVDGKNTENILTVETAGNIIKTYLQETQLKKASVENYAAVEEMVQALEFLLKEDKQRLKEADKEAEQLEKAYKELLDELTEKQSRNREFDNLDKKQKQYEELQQQEGIYLSRMQELLGVVSSEMDFSQLKNKLLIRIDTLERGLPAYERYDSVQKEYHKADRECSSLKEEIREKKAQRKEKEKRRQETTSKLDSLEHIEEKRVEAENLLEDVEQADADWKENFQEAEKMLQREERWKASFADCEHAEQERNHLTAERNKKQHAFLAGQAGLLAAEMLTEGEACPVCGSTSHPNPAKRAENAVTREEIDEIDEMLKQAEESYRNLYTKIESERQALEEGKRQLANRFARVCGKVVSKELQQLISGEKIFLPDSISEKDYLKKLTEQQVPVLTVIGKEKEQQKSRTEEYRMKEREKKDSQKTLKLLEQEIQTMDAEERTAEEQIKQWEMETIRLQEQLAGMKKDFVYASYEEAKAALQRSRDCMQEADAYEEERNRCHSDVRALQEKLEDRTRIDLTEDLQRQEEMEQQRKQQTENIQKIRSRRDRNEKQLQAIKKEMAKRQELFHQYEVLEPMVRTAEGRLTGKPGIDLEIYCQRRYMQRIVAAANKRLEKMSRGSLLLQCKSLEEIGGSRGSAGLELNVYAADTAMIRDVKSLSGGESFLASLAMALGLSDVISAMNGAVKFDTMFIDEGFGALDEENRESAMQAFSELAGDSRMIGIISHVSELKERIDKKILVKKLKNGSKIEMRLES